MIEDKRKDKAQSQLEFQKAHATGIFVVVVKYSGYLMHCLGFILATVVWQTGSLKYEFWPFVLNPISSSFLTLD